MQGIQGDTMRGSRNPFLSFTNYLRRTSKLVHEVVHACEKQLWTLIKSLVERHKSPTLLVKNRDSWREIKFKIAKLIIRRTIRCQSFYLPFPSTTTPEGVSFRRIVARTSYFQQTSMREERVPMDLPLVYIKSDVFCVQFRRRTERRVESSSDLR